MHGVGGKSGWSWIVRDFTHIPLMSRTNSRPQFIIEGLATMVVGVSCWWCVQDWPHKAKFLSPEDRIRIRLRMDADKQASPDEPFSKQRALAAFRDWKTYAYAVAGMGSACPLYAFSLFAPTILAGMGYHGSHAQLMSVPPYVVGAVGGITVGYLADRTRRRGIYILTTVPIAMVGYIVLIAAKDPHIQYGGMFLAAAGIYSGNPQGFAWLANNFEGSYKRGVALGTVTCWANLNGIVASNVYLKQENPRYWTGHGVVLAYLTLFGWGGTAVIYTLLKIENRKRRLGQRDGMLEGKTAEEIQVAGDKRPDFIYTI
jgi:hypothetical protein